MTLVDSVVYVFNPFTPGNFSEKLRLQLIDLFSGQFVAKKHKTCPTRCLQVDHFLMPKYSFRSLGKCKRQKLQDSAPGLLPITFSSPYFCLSCPAVFFCWAFTRHHFIGKRFLAKPRDRKIFKEFRWDKIFIAIFCSNIFFRFNQSINQSIIYFNTLRWRAKKLVQNTNLYK